MPLPVFTMVVAAPPSASAPGTRFAPPTLNVFVPPAPSPVEVKWTALPVVKSVSPAAMVKPPISASRACWTSMVELAVRATFCKPAEPL